MLELIRIAFFKKSLRALLSKQRKYKLHTTQSAKTIGLLFDATVEKDWKVFCAYGKLLEQDGKKVQLLGFFQAKQTPETPGFEGFSLKETDWTRKPTSEKVDRFVKTPLDLLICFNPANLPALAWTALASEAKMKIGTAASLAHDFDLQLEVPQNNGPQYFIEQMHLYLEKLS